VRAEAGPPGAAARLEARAEGVVQGVGFRVSVRREAVRLGLAGWVANMDDGSVEVVAEGPRERCEELLAWLEGEEAPGLVRQVARRWTAAGGVLPGFTVR